MEAFPIPRCLAVPILPPPMLQPRKAAAAAGDRAGADEGAAEWGSVTSMTAATSATAKPGERSDSAAHWRNHPRTSA